MFATIVQLKQSDVMTIVVMSQNKILFKDWVSIIKTNTNGATIRLPTEQMRGSAFGKFTFSLKV